jgi:dolichol-phosphate mannosyltransferase
MDFKTCSPLLFVPYGSLEIFTTPFLANKLQDNAIELSLIIPTYNESRNLPILIPSLIQLLDDTIPDRYELIVVDDNSPDKTWEVATNLTTRYRQLKVMRRESEKGLSTAVIRGWQVAKGRILGVIDADLQHPPEILWQLWQEMQRGADLAVASRHVEGGGVSEWNLMRRFLSRGAQMLGLLILPEVVSRLSDPMSGYFMVRRDTISGMVLNPVGYKILIEVVARGRIRWIGEVGYVFRERQAGASKVTWKQYLEYIRHLLELRIDLLPVRRFIRFGITGFSGVFVDFGIFYLLRTILELGLTRSTILSSEIAIINNFLWNDVWTFGDISRQQKGWRKRLKRLLKFNLICLSGLVLNVLCVNFLFNVLEINEYISKLIAIAAVTSWNFWFNLKLSWRVTDAGK